MTRFEKSQSASTTWIKFLRSAPSLRPAQFLTTSLPKLREGEAYNRIVMGTQMFKLAFETGSNLSQCLIFWRNLKPSPILRCIRNERGSRVPKKFFLFSSFACCVQLTMNLQVQFVTRRNLGTFSDWNSRRSLSWCIGCVCGCREHPSTQDHLRTGWSRSAK